MCADTVLSYHAARRERARIAVRLLRALVRSLRGKPAGAYAA
jgi:hypothetical protein